MENLECECAALGEHAPCGPCENSDGFNTETIIVEWNIESGFAGADHRGTWEFEPGELPTDREERDKILEEWLETEIANRISAGYYVVGEE